MKVRTMAVTAALTLTSSLAFAQAVSPGATVPERPVTVAPDPAPRVVDPAGTIQNDRTTGMTPVRPATPGAVPGARDKSRVGGEGVHDRAPGGQ
jgi:hypothetical protein